MRAARETTFGRSQKQAKQEIVFLAVAICPGQAGLTRSARVDGGISRLYFFLRARCARDENLRSCVTWGRKSAKGRNVTPPENLFCAESVLGMGGGSRIVVAHGFRKIHSLRHGDGDRCRLEMPTSASWLGAQTPSYAFGHSIGHRDLLTDNTSTRWAELWRPQGRSLRWMDGRGIIARSRTPVDHLKQVHTHG